MRKTLSVLQWSVLKHAIWNTAVHQNQPFFRSCGSCELVKRALHVSDSSSSWVNASRIKLNAHYAEQFLQDLIVAIPHWFTKTNPDWMSELNDKCLHYTQLSKSNARAKYKTLSALKSISHWLLKTSQQPAERRGATGLRCWHGATSGLVLRLPVELFRHTSLSWQPYCCAKASIREYAGSLIWIHIWIN